MAIDNFRGTQIGYDPTIRQRLEEEIIKLTPDGLEGNINTSDYALIFAGMIETIVLKTGGSITKATIVSNGVTVTWDTTTNYLTVDDDQKGFYAFARAFSAGAIATAVGYGLGFTPVGPVVGFAIGNTLSTWFNNNVFDAIVGAKLYYKIRLGINEPLTFVTSSNLEQTLNEKIGVR